MHLFDFNEKSNIKDWNVVDDTVMGGRSAGNFKLDEKGHGVFYGEVSLENNGGFSSLRYNMPRKAIEGYNFLVLSLKGDGKQYQARIKQSDGDYYSYVYNFTTSGEWETVKIPLNEMEATFRGRKLNMDNFSGEFIEEFTILIGNKKPQQFKLMLDKIELQ